MKIKLKLREFSIPTKPQDLIDRYYTSIQFEVQGRIRIWKYIVFGPKQIGFLIVKDTLKPEEVGKSYQISGEYSLKKIRSGEFKEINYEDKT
jgi:hypothetical protein